MITPAATPASTSGIQFHRAGRQRGIANQDGLVIRKWRRRSTVTTVSYIDEAVEPRRDHDRRSGVVVSRSRTSSLTKAFSVAEVDANDLPRVT